MQPIASWFRDFCQIHAQFVQLLPKQRQIRSNQFARLGIVVRNIFLQPSGTRDVRIFESKMTERHWHGGRSAVTFIVREQISLSKSNLQQRLVGIHVDSQPDLLQKHQNSSVFQKARRFRFYKQWQVIFENLALLIICSSCNCTR